jgi:hypothetical protein
LGNGTILNLTQFKEDLYVTLTVPIRDLDLANFDYAKIFSDSGYDIYNKNSNFYNDICSPASNDDNDITLKDRKKDIYPNNVTLCKDNCVYKEVDIETQRIVCECNINADKINEKKEDNYFIVDEEDANIIDYLLDNLNYKIFKCVNLFNIDNLIANPAFYGSLAIGIAVIISSITFIISGIPNIRISMYKKIPTEIKVKKLILEHEKMLNKNNNDIRLNEPAPPKKRKAKVITEQPPEYNSFSTQTPKNNKKSKKKGRKSNFINTESNVIQLRYDKFNKELNKQEVSNNDETNDFNKLPYSKALREDKRNIFQLIYSITLEKIELFQLFICGNYFKSLLVCQYLLSLLLDFFFNTLFYSDEIVSRKYHNDGNLGFIVTFTLSLLSNIISAFCMHFLESANSMGEKIELIHEIKSEYKYLYALSKVLKFIKIRIAFALFTEIVIMGCCLYYLSIFFTVYRESRTSLLINFLTSLLESLIKTIAIIVIVAITRLVGLSYKNKYLYNTSKFINDTF